VDLPEIDIVTTFVRGPVCAVCDRPSVHEDTATGIPIPGAYVASTINDPYRPATPVCDCVERHYPEMVERIEAERLHFSLVALDGRYAQGCRTASSRMGLGRMVGPRETRRSAMVDQQGSQGTPLTDSPGEQGMGRRPCRRRKHQWRSRGRGDALTYVCQVCGETRDEPPRRRWGGQEAPGGEGGGGGIGG
jgi:hypothetical protein